ncbi:MAG: hypothetical protein DMF06_00655 [Verrucomicrobia bacterium]|nr:MAG: hypothetical protein DMF06_00655 [Verrucomicrobiota bacterium]
MAVAATTAHAMKTEILWSDRMPQYARANNGREAFRRLPAAACSTISKFEYRNPKQIQITKRGNDLNGDQF